MPIAATCSLVVEIAIKSAVVIGVAWIIVALLRGKSAALRHLIWSVAFAGVLTLPLFSIALPAMRVPVRPSLAISELVFRTEAISPSRQPPEAASDSGSATKAIPVMADWRVLFLLIWAGGAAISLAQMLMAWVSVERLRLTARQGSEANFAVLARRLRVEKKVLLFEGSAGSMPMTYGLFRPAIFIPVDANNWSAERRRIVLLHELAHVRRGDGATHLMARLALILYWWNPLVWVAWREFLREGELAADDLVLNLGACGSEYATHLLEIARSMQTPGISGWPVVAMASRSQLEGRLEAILDSQRDRRAPRTMMAAVVLLVAIGLIAPLAAMQAKRDVTQEASKQTGAPAAISFLMQQGDEARENGRNEVAKAVYSKLLAASGNGTEAAAALLRRGTVELAMKDIPAAIADFEQAQADDSGKAAEARMWLAIAQQRQHNVREARTLYESSLAVTDPHSPAAATTMELYAQMLEADSDQLEAGKLRQQASEIRTAQTAQAAAKPQTFPPVYRAGGDTSSPVLISKVEPEYTAEARIAGYSGTSLLSVLVGADGMIRDVQVRRSQGFGLDEKAIEAVLQWKFKPGIREGQAVVVRATIEINFHTL